MGSISLAPSFGQQAGSLSCHKTVGRMSWSFHGSVCTFDAFVEPRDHACIISIGLAIDGKHARSVANAQHLLAGQLPMHIACQRGQISDILDMGFLVQDGLIEVRDAPAMGNVKLE